MNNWQKFCVAAVALGAAPIAAALNPGDVVDNFRLLDHRGKSHELYYLSDMKAVVLMTQSNGCKSSAQSISALQSIKKDYEERGVRVFMLNSRLEDDRTSIAAEMDRLGADIPVLDDALQLIGESFGAVQAGEAFVINPRGWKVAYRGPVNGALAKPAKANAQYVRDAVDALLAGEPVKTTKAQGSGCGVNLPGLANRSAHAKISYSETIAPILIEKCVTCHRKDGIGPWQMTSYEMVRGFAPMIRETLRTERMPPWHADPHYGVFKNSRGLTNEQTQALVHWIEAGAPRDNAPDPLANLNKDWPDWPLGEPDLIVETPAFNVPATGTIDYQNPIVANPLGRDVWVRAIAFNPGNRPVVHHILAYGVKATGNGPFGGAYLAGYVPGGGVVEFPEDTGVLLTKDMNFRFQMHYTTNGKEGVDVTKIGLYFSKEPPKYPLRQFVLLDPRLRIPPLVKEHRIVAPPRTFDRDVLIYSLTAHSHYRGKSSKFVAQYPDGREEVLLSVPNYDFNWQTTYDLVEPKMLPKGTKLVYDTVFDNSVQNRANPDPNIEVLWGEQSWEEMIYGNVRFRVLDETVDSAKLTQTSGR